MIANTFLVAGALASLVAAVPMPNPDIVWETYTEVALTTQAVTTTVWLEPGETPPTVGKQHYGHGHGHGGHGGYGKPSAQPQPSEPVASAAPSSPAAPAPAPSSPKSAPPAPAPSSYEQPTSQAPAPQPTTTQAPAPEPTSEAAPPAYTPPAYTPSAEPTSAPAPEPSQPSNNGGGSSSGGSNGLSGMAAAGVMHSGDMTYWTPALGACGWTNTESEAVVAIAESLFDQYDVDGNPNHNELCGKYVSIIGEDGSPTQAKVVDRCGGCATTDLDLSPSLFKTVVPNGDGRVPGVEWSFA